MSLEACFALSYGNADRWPIKALAVGLKEFLEERVTLP
jgi:hypothetical protein